MLLTWSRHGCEVLEDLLSRTCTPLEWRLDVSQGHRCRWFISGRPPLDQQVMSQRRFWLCVQFGFSRLGPVPACSILCTRQNASLVLLWDLCRRWEGGVAGGGSSSLRLRAMAVEPGTRSYGEVLRLRLFSMRGKVCKFIIYTWFERELTVQPLPTGTLLWFKLKLVAIKSIFMCEFVCLLLWEEKLPYFNSFSFYSIVVLCDVPISASNYLNQSTQMELSRTLNDA